jgi:hypothetical protein
MREPELGNKNQSGVAAANEDQGPVAVAGASASASASAQGVASPILFHACSLFAVLHDMLMGLNLVRTYRAG